MDISIVVPLYNEEESLPHLAEWIDRVMAEHGFSYEVIMVDDGSKDGSWDVVERLHRQNSCYKGIRFRRNYGKSAALNVGFGRAEGEVVRDANTLGSAALRTGARACKAPTRPTCDPP